MKPLPQPIKLEESQQQVLDQGRSLDKGQVDSFDGKSFDFFEGAARREESALSAVSTSSAGGDSSETR